MAESRTEKSIKNILFGVTSKFLVLILGFVDRKFFIGFLGDELLGVNGLFSNVLLMLSLAELGITNVMVYSYYKPLAEGNYEKLNSLTRFYKKIYTLIAIIVAAVGIFLIPFLKYIVKTEHVIDNLVLIYIIFVANTVVSYLFVYKSTILTADQQGYLVSKVQIRVDVIRQLVQIVVLIVFRDIILYLLVKLVAVLMNNLILVRIVKKRYQYLDDKNAEDISKEEKHEIFSTVASGFIYKFAGILLNGTDNILISSLVGTILVGYVANYDTIIVAIMGFVTIFYGSITASLGNLNVSASSQKKKEVFDIMLYIGFWISLIVIPCCYCLLGDFIKVWLGEKYVLGNDILIVKLSMMYLSCTLNTVFSFREATALFKKTKYAIFAGSVMNIILSIVLGRVIGLVGILVASIISMLATYVWYEPVIIYKKYFETSPAEYFYKHLKNLLVICGMIFVMYKLTINISVTNWITLIFKASICFGISVVISFIYQCSQKEYAAIKERMGFLVNKFIKRN